MATSTHNATTGARPSRVQKKANVQDAPREMRLSIRTSAEQMDLLQRAALSRGTDPSAFVLQASLEQARQAVADESVIVLSPSDYEQLCRALDEPVRPTEALNRSGPLKPCARS